MTPFAKISRLLVGVDFDEASGSALKMAGALAAAWDAEITVVHSATEETPAYFTANQIDALEAERDQGRARTATELRAFAERHLASAVRVVVAEGPPADAILRIAAAFDLIVVGTHRRQGPWRWWLGSVAEAVVVHSPRPVLVVPTGTVVPETHRPLTILAAGSDGAAMEAWVDVLRTAFGGNVIRSVDLQHCSGKSLETADVIVMSMAAPGRGPQAQFGATADVLKECVHPVLFVPSPHGIVERSPS